MTDTSGTFGSSLQSDAQSQHVIAGSVTFTPIFGPVRPILLRHELPKDALNGVAGRAPLLVQLLHNRGLSGAQAISEFMAGDWHLHGPALLHLDRAVGRIRQAIRDRARIVVFGDFDCDGITSCALLTLALEALGANAHAYVPRRDDDGRGLNTEAVRELAEQGTSLIVTTDCGTANVAEVELAHELGVEVIVTDHHPPHGPLAPAYALINPRQEGDDSLEKELAGVGVAFRVAEALLADMPDATTSLAFLLDLVAIGTIADIVPLTPSNWALVRAGLRQIREAPRPGIRALLTLARMWPDDVVARDVSFALAPRINACGRMGRPDLALALLRAADVTEADRLAREVETLNMQRQVITDEIVAMAREQAAVDIAAKADVVVTQGDQWPLGVLGLVAGRLAEEYHRPVFVISRDGSECRGSARGPVGVDLGAVLAVRPDFFKRFGGHAQAAGFTIATQALPEFLAYLKASFSTAGDTGGTPGSGEVRDAAPVTVDCRLALHRLGPDSDVYETLEMLEPFGAGFAEPVFLCPGARILGCRRSGVGGRTLRLRLAYHGTTREFIWSRRGEICETLRSSLSGLPPVDVAFTLRKYRRSADGEAEWLAHIETLAPTVSFS